MSAVQVDSRRVSTGGDRVDVEGRRGAGTYSVQTDEKSFLLLGRSTGGVLTHTECEQEN